MATGHGAGTGEPSGTRSTSSLDTLVAANLREVRARLERAARSAGRDPAEISLIAVSKTFGLDHVRAAAAAGQADFGENRVQEALQKCTRASDLSIRWHLIGHLQSNKIRKAIAPFSWVHSVDSVDLLRRLDQAAVDQQVAPSLLIQVDLAGEATKHGAPVETARDIVRAAAACQAVWLRGLMILPPWHDDPERTRPYFRRLRELRDDMLSAGLDPALLQHLSMGMSHDFEVAIQEGSTLVRVGTAIFGARPTAVAGPAAN